jgi:hypothetical protein
MNSEQIWKTVWNLIAIGFGLLALFAGRTALKPPYDFTFFIIWTVLGFGAKVMAEYGADWFDIW